MLYVARRALVRPDVPVQRDADSKAGERLRTLALEFSAFILANREEFSEAARWLVHLPRCRRSRSIRGKTPGEAIHVDVEEEHELVCGPICRRLEDGWACATYPFPPRADRFISFGANDAKRLAILTAITFDRDFDGAEIGLGWSWEGPPESPALLEGRCGAWVALTAVPGSEVWLLEIVEEASRVLRLKLPRSTAHLAADAPEDARARADLLELKAVRMVAREPGIPDAVVARRLGVHRSTVGRWKRVRAARAMAADDPRRGWAVAGQVEAVEPVEE